MGDGNGGGEQDDGFSPLFWLALIVGIIGVVGFVAVASCPSCF